MNNRTNEIRLIEFIYDPFICCSLLFNLEGLIPGKSI
jgi:hypothetical protein